MTVLTCNPPLILDFDGSVLPLAENETRIPLGQWQECIRFGCTKDDFGALERHLSLLMPPSYGCVFTGSGDYHHVSLFLLGHLARQRALGPDSLDVVVCDNHPDNMHYLFGLHCGSWIAHAARLGYVRQVHVLGITSPDIDTGHAWENRILPLLRRKLTYWSVHRKAGWLKLLGRSSQARDFGSPGDLLEAFAPVLADAPAIYLSLDKDVFSPQVVRTNWDQGVFGLEHAETVIRLCRDRLAGMDVTGEVSEYTYSSRFKQFLSRIDGQEAIPPDAMQAMLVAHQAVNQRLLHALRAV